MDHPEDRKKKRRIPQDLRKRALVSCDRCKKKRIRCLRVIAGSTQESACSNCLESGVKCESTVPRKQRIYGSIETLSIRYRVLDALIKGLYPEQDTSSIDVLYEIAEAKGIEVPSGGGGEPMEEDLLSPESNPVRQQMSISPPVVEKPTFTDQFNQSQVVTQNTAEVLEEKTSGSPQTAPSSHFIGPSSSFGFVLAIRDLVAQYNAGPITKPASQFSIPPASKLEPIYQGKDKEALAWTTSGDLNGIRLPSEASRPLSAPPPLKPESGTHCSLKPLHYFLPPRAITDRAIDTFFEMVHPHYMLFHRPTFEARYSAVWTDTKPIQDLESGWCACLFMAFVFGSLSIEGDSKEPSMELYRHRYLGLVLPRMHQLLNTSTLLNLQGLLLLQLYQHNNRERNSSWMLLGCTSRMALALGMHQEGSATLSDPVEREVRRMVWWTMYNFEHNLCMILGRPSAIDETAINVNFPDEKILECGRSAPSGYLEYSVRLTKLIVKTKREMYDNQDKSLRPPEGASRINAAKQLLRALEEWHRSLPNSLRLEYISPLLSHKRAVLLLHTQYHHVQTLVTRPFILRKVESQLAFHLGWKLASPGLDPRESTLSNFCCNFARQAVLSLQDLASLGILDGVIWMDFYYVYHAVLTMALDFLARPQNQRDTAEDLARKAAVRSILNSVRNARLCPTFAFLIKVSLQLAKIVGVLDQPGNSNPDDLRSYQISVPPTHQITAPPNDLSSGGYMEDFINDWFQIDPANLPWQFFGPVTSGDANNGQEAFSVNSAMAANMVDSGGARFEWEGFTWDPVENSGTVATSSPARSTNNWVFNGMSLGP